MTHYYRVDMRVRLAQVVIDSRRPTELVRFWAALLGGAAVDRAHGWAHVEAPGFPRLSFQPVPEPKSAKNRLHLDVEVDAGGIPDAVDRAVELGGAVVGSIVADEQGSFQVMLDPEQNEFCFVSD